MSEQQPTDQRKAAYKLCWSCNKRFSGNHKFEVAHPTQPGVTVFVHKQCKSAVENYDNEPYHADEDDDGLRFR